jgi:hypothetical protein
MVFEVSLRQLAVQTLLFLLYFVAEPYLYAKFIFALRKLLTFLAAYWVFAMLFKVDFPLAGIFTLKIVYLALITVAVWASLDKAVLWAELKPLCKSKICKALLSYSLATWLFLKHYLEIHKAMDKQDSIAGILDKALAAGKQVHDQSADIETKVKQYMHMESSIPQLNYSANLYGLLFLCILVLVNGL